ncbi:MAG: hypothetical protein HKN51_16045 [Saprospiraceae bacterium]|nr:hypothetical protein [Saprospiraceae bacterium]
MRIKLVLTGGGTRGIYQIGVIKALQESQLWDSIVSISGCSIGAINGAAILQYPIDKVYELWMEIAKREIFEGIDQQASDFYVQIAKESILNDGVNINPFIGFFEEYLDEDIIRESDKEFVITAYNVSDLKQEYFSLDTISKGQLIDHVVASSRLPFFQPIYINEKKYIDGGVGDNQPYFSFLENKHFDLIITIKIMYIPYYIPGLRIDNITADDNLVIASKKYLGNPLNFKKPTFKEKFDIGYADGLEAIENYKKNFM